MEEYYSKVDSSKLLHVVCRLVEFESITREEVVPDNNFIQCAMLNMDKKIFRPHKHIFKDRQEHKIAQESWVVIKGSAKCIFYDINDEILVETVLYPGDASFTLEGGHTYEILEDNTLVYEYKTGPYEGQENDKVFL